jgi:hypothetical protein
MSGYYNDGPGSDRGGGYGVQRNSRLPADPENINERNWQRDTPNIGRCDAGQLGDFLRDLVDALVIEIQNNASRSPLRVFAYNLWSDRGYANAGFHDLIKSFSSYVEATAILNNVNDAQGILNIIKGEVEFFVSSATAFLTTLFPDVVEFLPVEAEPAITDSLRDWAEIVRSVRTTQRQAPAQRGNGGGGGGYGARAPGGGGYGRVQINQPQGDLRPIWERGQGGSTVRNPNDAAAPRTGFNGVNHGAPIPDAPRRYAEVLNDTAETLPVRDAAELKRVDLTAKSPIRTEPSSSRYQARSAVANPRPYDRVVLEDGSVLIPAFMSGLTVSYSVDCPPIVYDRNVYMLFHRVFKDGTVYESIQEKTETMLYLEHELDESLKKIYRTNSAIGAKERVEPEIILAKRLVPNQKGTIASLVSEEKRKELDAADAPRQLLRPIRTNSFQDALFKAQLEAARLDEESLLLEFQVEESTQYDLSEGALPSMLELRRCTSYASFIETVWTMHRTDKISDDLALLIDARMTKAFNRFNKKSMYLQWTVDSFLGDFEALLGEVSKKLGDGVTTVFLGGYKEVIGSAMAVLTGESLSEFIKQMPESDRELVKEPAIFCDRYSVTQLPWTLYDMQHHWRLEGVVTRENAEPLHAALTAIFARTATNDTHVRILLTSDNHRIHAYKSAIMTQNFVVALSAETVNAA